MLLFILKCALKDGFDQLASSETFFTGQAAVEKKTVNILFLHRIFSQIMACFIVLSKTHNSRAFCFRLIPKSLSEKFSLSLCEKKKKYRKSICK